MIISEFFKCLYLFSLNTNLPSTFVLNKTYINIINNEKNIATPFWQNDNRLHSCCKILHVKPLPLQKYIYCSLLNH